MTIIYTSPYKSHIHSKKAVDWFTENNLPFEERQVTKDTPLSEEEVLNIFKRSTNPLEIIATKSVTYQRMEEEILDMNMKNQFVPFMASNVRLFKYPMILHEKALIVGYNKDELKELLSEQEIM